MAEESPEVKPRGPRGPVIACPKCDHRFMVNVRVEVSDLMLTEDGLQLSPTRTLTDAERKFMEEAREARLFEPFAKAVELAKAGQVPRDMERFFMTVMKTAAARKVPPFALERFRREYPRSRIDFWVSQGIGILLADGAIRQFVPADLVTGRTIKSLGGDSVKTKTNATPEGLEEWTRTRFGYVVGRGAFFDALRQKSIGAFSRPGLL
jgi:DNA-directed RNA polymerase subunit RPC12/RpoP